MPLKMSQIKEGMVLRSLEDYALRAAGGPKGEVKKGDLAYVFSVTPDGTPHLAYGRDVWQEAQRIPHDGAWTRRRIFYHGAFEVEKSESALPLIPPKAMRKGDRLRAMNTFASVEDGIRLCIAQTTPCVVHATHTVEKIGIDCAVLFFRDPVWEKKVTCKVLDKRGVVLEEYHGAHWAIYRSSGARVLHLERLPVLGPFDWSKCSGHGTRPCVYLQGDRCPYCAEGKFDEPWPWAEGPAKAKAPRPSAPAPRYGPVGAPGPDLRHMRAARDPVWEMLRGK